MEIRGSENKVSIIRFRHKGSDMAFECYTEPNSYSPVEDFHNFGRAEISFNDLTEVSMMIEMLERFKRECSGRFGTWRPSTK